MIDSAPIKDRNRMVKLLYIMYHKVGRKGDRQEAWLNWAGFSPEDEGKEPLLLATTFSVENRLDAQGVIKVYEKRLGTGDTELCQDLAM